MENRLQEYLNKKADEYLKLIIYEFGNLSIKNDAGEITSKAEELISNNIVVVEKMMFDYKSNIKKKA